MDLLGLVKELESNLEINKIKEVLKNYNSNDYKNFIKFTVNSYNRVILHSDNNFDLILICWDINQFSKIHDHPEYCCIVRLLEGELLEENFHVENGIIKHLNNNIIKPGDITMKVSNKIVHRIIPVHKAVSLHVYIPGKYKPNFYDKIENI